ncbi:lytic transglycosylase domain-containing protein [Gordonia sp. N1V]|uniref:lytic transglycosylase domain-containing protein n=1 Tax=Gordonia sp. N1V TaxID=3034163 RepID=UPI0023E243C6|nr:lytic transglycosylase domain-containing protein [Gordonia sp. N1V]MDF3285039.1 lytic transglycosylase domain-containing protein [Gordonia sp. N1V]
MTPPHRTTPSRRRAVLVATAATVCVLAGLLTGCQQSTDRPVLLPDAVPAAFAPWITKAGNQCAEITAPVLAAQIDAEAGFTLPPPTTSGADGPAQWVPPTWVARYVDGDGDARRDPRSVPDAVMTLAAYDCDLTATMREARAHGLVHGDLVALTLSAYHCGAGATVRQGRPCQNAQTQRYLTTITDRARTVFTA